MLSHAVSLATKGILGCSTPATKGIIFVCIVETPLRRRGAPGVQGEKRRKIVSVFYNYDNKLYEYKQAVDDNVTITAQNVSIEIVNSKPVVTFKISE